MFDWRFFSTRREVIAKPLIPTACGAAHPSRSWPAHVLVIFGSAFAIAATQFRAGTPIYLFHPGDVGVWIDAADRVVQGEVLYRDFFDFLVPGVVYVNALLFTLFGRTPAALSIGVIAVGTALAYVLFLAVARTSSRVHALLAPLAFIALVYIPFSPGNHKWLAMLCGVSGTFVLSSMSRCPLHLCIAGSLHALSLLCTQDLGMAFVAGSLMILALDRRNGFDMLPYVLSLLIVLIAVMSYFFALAGVSSVLDALLFPLGRYSEANRFSLHFDFYYGWRAAPRSIAHLILWVGCLIALAKHLRWKAARADQFVVLTGLLVLIVSVSQRGIQPSFLAFSCTPLIPLYLGKPGVPRMVLAVLAAGSLFALLGTIVARQTGTHFVREQHRAGAVWTPRPMTEVTWIETFAPPDGYAFVLPLYGGANFLSRTRNPSPHLYLVERFSTPDQIKEVLAGIESHRPAAGAWTTDVSGSASTLDTAFQRLLRTYVVVGRTQDGMHLLLRRGMTGSIEPFRKSTSSPDTPGVP